MMNFEIVQMKCQVKVKIVSYVFSNYLSVSVWFFRPIFIFTGSNYCKNDK